MWLNGKEISLSGGRFQSCLREIRRRARDFEDEKKGIKIKKEDWEKLHVHIASYNNFPPLLVWPLRLLALLVWYRYSFHPWKANECERRSWRAFFDSKTGIWKCMPQYLWWVCKMVYGEM
ncbi:hypothetical protein HU200_008488 [Digitaria exilis]|uniref:Uncharacterized protein n=1 Tax=Digitaria exilis TaxID=1010633 RepID=A0A835FNS8_9POAL|nr:hypothetical protein HU200_008488 [Digitaria exilis]